MRERRRITSTDVAKEVGFSQATVSYVLSEKKDVSIRPETRDRIRAAAKKLGYRPNRLARSLRMGKTHVIGIVAPCVTFSYFSEIIRSAEDVLSENGYVLALAHSDEKPDRERKSVSTLVQHNVDGLIIIPAGGGSRSGIFEEISKDQVPCVLVDKKIAGSESAFVGTDDVGGAAKAVRYLASLGHRRIAFIRGPAGVSTAEDRFKGYLQGLQEHGLEYDARYAIGHDWTEEQGTAATHRLLDLHPRPTAIFACSDLLAWGVYAALADAGPRVPEDVSVIGFADLKPSHLLSVPLTTLRQPSRKIGRRAAEILLGILSNESTDKQQILFPTELIVRRSCCRPRTSQ